MAEFEYEVTMEIKLDPRWRQLEQEFKDLVEIAARRIETLAKDKVPVDIGTTKNSIAATEEGELEWIIGPTTEYAPFLEFGTVYMKERPFMVPAAEEMRPNIDRAVRGLTEKLK